jgi:PPOX class probable F420-dependent enzyme
MAEISEDDRKFLRSARFAVVSTIRPDGSPHQTPMWYELGPGQAAELLLNTPRGSLKHTHLKRDPRLSVCVVDGYRYVTLAGTAELFEDEARAKADYARLGKRYRATFLRMLPRFLLRMLTGRARGGRPSDDRISIYVRVQRVSSSSLG